MDTWAFSSPLPVSLFPEEITLSIKVNLDKPDSKSGPSEYKDGVLTSQLQLIFMDITYNCHLPIHYELTAGCILFLKEEMLGCDPSIQLLLTSLRALHTALVIMRYF